MPIEEETFAGEMRLGLVDPQGRVVLQLALLATLYFEQGHDLAKRQAIATCFAEYRAMVGEHLRWAHPGRSGFDRLDRPAIRDPAVWLVEPGFDTNCGWEFTWHGGATKEDASHFSIRALGLPAWEPARGALSFVSFAFPIAWFSERGDDLPSLLLRFCERLQPAHGYGGYGLVQSPNRFRRAHHEKTVYALAQRHPGLEIDEPIVHSIALRHGIKGVNWLTVVGERWIEALGGLEVLRSALQPPAQLHPFPGGALISAGSHPQLGDVDRAHYPRDYGPVSRVLRGIRTPTHPRLHSVGPFDAKNFQAWLGRLDGL